MKIRRDLNRIFLHLFIIAYDYAYALVKTNLK